MTTLAQVYLRGSSMTEEISSFGPLIDLAAKQSAQESFAFDVQIETRVAEGSVKIWATVLTVGLPLYGAVSDYSGFKASLGESE